jgi:transposase InsO family protein
VGDGDDNAVAESSFASRRAEPVARHDWPTRAAARAAIFEYIEAWYNRQRLHSTPGYLSPAQFATRAQATSPEADRSEKPKQAHR